MATNGTVPREEIPLLISNPWPAIAVGLASALFAAFQVWAVTGPWYWSRLILAGVGALAAGIGVAIRPKSPAVLGLAALVAFLGSVAVNTPNARETSWDVAVTLLRVLAAVALAAAILMSLPQTPRRIAISALLIFHFGGILTAVTSAAPQPWLSGQLWTYVYRPYLYFMYLNNAYHFYSPEPGPATLLWFRVEYENKYGKKHWRWVKVPNLKDGKPDPDMPKLEYTRRLSLADYANQPGPTVPEELFMKVLAPARMAAAERRVMQPLDAPHFKANYMRGIPIHPDYPLAAQYREPNSFSKYWIRSFVRHVARSYPHETYPELQVTGIKLYKVVHRLPSALDLAAKNDMNDPQTQLPYYMGDFDRDGNLRDIYGEIWDGSPAKQDPLLYWIIPMARYPRGGTMELKDYLSIHAGDEDVGSLP